MRWTHLLRVCVTRTDTARGCNESLIVLDCPRVILVRHMDKIKSGAMFTVREAGLEPARPKTQVPKTCVSANSTTPARVRRESK